MESVSISLRNFFHTGRNVEEFLRERNSQLSVENEGFKQLLQEKYDQIGQLGAAKEGFEQLLLQKNDQIKDLEEQIIRETNQINQDSDPLLQEKKWLKQLDLCAENEGLRAHLEAASEK